jgi:hypothetical protein
MFSGVYVASYHVTMASLSVEGRQVRVLTSKIGKRIATSTPNHMFLGVPALCLVTERTFVE